MFDKNHSLTVLPGFTSSMGVCFLEAGFDAGFNGGISQLASEDLITDVSCRRNKVLT